MRIPLFFREGGTELNSFFCVGDRDLEGRLSGAQRHGPHHHPGVAEYLVGLVHAFARHAADQVLHGDEHVVEIEGRRVRCADTVLFFALCLLEPRRSLFDDKEGGTFGCVRKERDKVGVSAGGNKNFAAVDGIPGDLPGIILDGLRGRLQSLEVAAGIRLRYGIGHQGAAVGDGAEPLFLLRFRTAHQQGIRPELNGKKGRGNSQADLGNLPDHRAAVAGAAADPSIRFRDE